MKSSARWTLVARLFRDDLNDEGAHPVTHQHTFFQVCQSREHTLFRPDRVVVPSRETSSESTVKPASTFLISHLLVSIAPQDWTAAYLLLPFRYILELVLLVIGQGG
jgi:hypothetical protein